MIIMVGMLLVVKIHMMRLCGTEQKMVLIIHGMIYNMLEMVGFYNRIVLLLPILLIITPLGPLGHKVLKVM